LKSNFMAKKELSERDSWQDPSEENAGVAERFL
jgi:hypothetical protein